MDAYQRVVLGDMLFLAQRAFPSQDLETLEREVCDKSERDQLFLAENESQIVDELLLLARAAFPGLSPQRIARVVQSKIETYRALRGVADPAPTTTIADFMPPSFPAGLVAM